MIDKFSFRCGVEGARHGIYFLPTAVAEEIHKKIEGSEYTKNKGISFRCLWGDPRIKILQEILESFGVKIYSWKNQSILHLKNKDGVVMQRELTFNDQDLDEAEYLALEGAEVRLELDDYFYGATGPRAGVASKVKHSFQFGRDHFDRGCILVGPKGKTLLQASDLKGFTFQEIELRGKKAGEEKFRTWHLESDIDVPMIADDYVDNDGNILTTYPDSGTCYPDTPWFPAVYRYHKKMIKESKSDFFLTVEAFGRDNRDRFKNAPVTRFKVPIISQKFRQFCIKQKWKINCRPIVLI